ncbi:hypothetical protein B0H14DRAFT_2507493 [Mycena olivaceomarginata]|nr:hypothetical protein B0H14DRAFT_2507493 [Mycena olivaceomarginata]
MMFSTTLTSAAVLLSLALHVSAHAMPLPALGVTGSPVRNDAQRLSTAKPCGSTDIASNLDKATAVPVEADGSTVMLNVTNFNPGADGSRSVSVLVDPTGTGKNFVAAKVTKNGDPAPKANGSDQVKLTLPAGTKCTGGKAGNLCLLSVKSTAGFGACTVVSQLSSGSSDSTPSASASAAPASTKVPCKSSKNKRRAVGTRAARALRIESEAESRDLRGNPVFAGTPL